MRCEMRSKLRSTLTGLVRRSRVERDMHEELESHIQRYADDLMLQGIGREEALRRARLEFGGLEPIKEDCRTALGFGLVDELRRNLEFGIRMMFKNRSLAILGVLSLALGIGFTTAGFSIVNMVVFRSLPVTHPEQLVYL